MSSQGFCQKFAGNEDALGIVIVDVIDPSELGQLDDYSINL